MNYRNRLCLSALVILLLPFAAPAQNIQVTSSANLDIPDGSSASYYALTDFGPVLVGNTRTRTFRIHNTSSVTTLTMSTFIVANSTNFGISAPASSFTAGPSKFTTFDLTFHPAAGGIQSTVITIQSNDPDAENIYTFTVSGTGDALPPLTPGKDLSLLMTKPPKLKLNKNTGLIDAKFKLQISNLGTLDSTTPTLTVLRSNTSVLTLPAVIFTSSILKPLPAPVNGKIKRKKVNLKVTGLPNVSSGLFVFAETQGAFDLDFVDNVVSTNYRGFGP